MSNTDNEKLKSNKLAKQLFNDNACIVFLRYGIRELVIQEKEFIEIVSKIIYNKDKDGKQNIQK